MTSGSKRISAASDRSRRIARWHLRDRAPLLLLALLLVTGCGAPPPARNAVLIVLDGLRADRLSCYGFPQPTSPAIDGLAQRGVLFESVVSNSPWTLPAMAGLLLGDYPNRQGYAEKLRRSLVENIEAAGFQTAAFVEQEFAADGFVSPRFGFDRGFGEFRGGSFSAAGDWIRANHAEPFFVMVHAHETHLPYLQREWAEALPPGNLGDIFEANDAEAIQRGERALDAPGRLYLRALYDGGVSAADRQVAMLLATLDELNIRDQTLVVVTSDHGVDIGGREPEWPGLHGHSLYDEQVLVPLVIDAPRRNFASHRITWQVRSIDTLHTVLELLGIPPAPGQRGRSLVPLMTGEEQAGRMAFTEVVAEPLGFTERIAVRTAGHKLIMKRGPDRRFDRELYELRSDPGERVNQARMRPAQTARLRNVLLRIRRATNQRGAALYTLAPPGEAAEQDGQGEGLPARQIEALGTPRTREVAVGP